MIMSQETPRPRMGLGVVFVAMFALVALPGLHLGSSRLQAKPDDAATDRDIKPKAAKNDSDRRATDDVLIISEILKRVEASYFEDVDQQVLVDAAIDAVLKKLDSETEYLDSDRRRIFQQALIPNFVGIGARLDLDDQHRVIVLEPLPGSPAQKAGLLPGDHITVVNKTDVELFPVNQRLAETVKVIRGEKGTTANLVIERQGTNDLVEIAITRDDLKLSSVSGFRPYKNGEPQFYCDEKQQIGYIHIRGFMNGTAKEVAKIVTKLEEEDARAIVLDLRFNGGGALSEAVATANIFVDQGTTLKVKKRNGEDDDMHVAEAAQTLTKLPMAVLINSQTGSAAEILAACLQDHNRATVIGQRSFGMGRVKSIVALSNGAALKLPIATVHRANGRSLHRETDMTEDDVWGVTPDDGNIIELSEEENALILEKITNPRSMKSEPVADRQLNRSIEVIQRKINS